TEERMAQITTNTQRLSLILFALKSNFLISRQITNKGLCPFPYREKYIFTFPAPGLHGIFYLWLNWRRENDAFTGQPACGKEGDGGDADADPEGKLVVVSMLPEPGPADRDRHCGDMVHGHPHGEAGSQFARTDDSMQVGGKANSKTEQHIVHQKQG